MAINNEIYPSNPLNNAVKSFVLLSTQFTIQILQLYPGILLSLMFFLRFFKLYYVETHNRCPSDTAQVYQPTTGEAEQSLRLLNQFVQVSSLFISELNRYLGKGMPLSTAISYPFSMTSALPSHPPSSTATEPSGRIILPLLKGNSARKDAQGTSLQLSVFIPKATLTYVSGLHLFWPTFGMF